MQQRYPRGTHKDKIYHYHKFLFVEKLEALLNRLMYPKSLQAQPPKMDQDNNQKGIFLQR